MSKTDKSAYPPLIVMGLMSGTSMDGIDAVAARISLSCEPVAIAQLTVLGQHSQDYPSKIRDRLFQIVSQAQVAWQDFCSLQTDVGQCFAQTAQVLCQQLQQNGHTVDLIASHGQTVFHQPPVGNLLGYSVQIGSPALINHVTGVPVVADFRPSDMAAGGQGAPLIPFADQLLFRHPTQHRAIQNIGGIANVTVLPAYNSSQTVFALDTGPGNMVIDACAQALFQQPLDPEGTLAEQGQVIPACLSTLMQHPFLTQDPPRSTGRETFGAAFVEDFLKNWQHVSSYDLMRTITEWTIQSLLHAYQNYVLPTVPVSEIIFGGGGVKNTFLFNQLQSVFGSLGIQTSTHEAYGLNSQYKEALAFALLGYARWYNLPNTLPQCTGTRSPISMGGIWMGHA